MLVKELKFGEGIEIDFSGSEIKTARVLIRPSRHNNAVKLYIEADRDIPICGIKPSQDGQTKGELHHGTNHRCIQE